MDGASKVSIGSSHSLVTSNSYRDSGTSGHNIGLYSGSYGLVSNLMGGWYYSREGVTKVSSIGESTIGQEGFSLSLTNVVA